MEQKLAQGTKGWCNPFINGALYTVSKPKMEKPSLRLDGLFVCVWGGGGGGGGGCYFPLGESETKLTTTRVSHAE